MPWLLHIVTVTVALTVGTDFPDGHSSWISTATRLREAAIATRRDILELRRRLVDATVTWGFSNNLDEIAKYARVSLNWPQRIFHETCKEPLRDDTKEMFFDFLNELDALIGNKARFPELKKMSDFLRIEVSQLKLNLNVERDRISVLEGIMSSTGFQTSSDAGVHVPSCASKGLSAFVDLQKLVTTRSQEVEAWCEHVGGCAAYFSRPRDSRLRHVAKYIEEQVFNSNQLMLGHFSDVVFFWEVLDSLAATLQDLEKRSLALSIRMSSVEALREHISLDWANNFTMPSLVPCGSLGMSSESVYQLLETHFRFAVQSFKDLPQILPAAPSRSDACNVSFLAFAWAEFVDIDADLMATWNEVICERIRSISKVWEILTARSSELHLAMLLHLPDYRSRAFDEVYTNQQWAGYGSSGTGSQETSTHTIAEAVSTMIQRHRIRVVLDLGCGWGEWLPPVLCSAVKAKRLPAGLHYIGWDIASAPVKGLLDSFEDKWSDCDIRWDFHIKDAVEMQIPDGINLVIARHVMQHLSHADSLSLLENIRKGIPDFVLLSQTKGANNVDMVDSSSFLHVSKPNEPKTFNGYDILQPPFQLPPPLEELSEARAGTSMLLFRGSDLEKRGMVTRVVVLLPSCRVKRFFW